MEKQCCEKIYDKLNWNGYQCSKKAIVERNGKSYCKVHDPEYIKTKDRKREEKYRKESCKCGHHFAYGWYEYCPICGLKREFNQLLK